MISRSASPRAFLLYSSLSLRGDTGGNYSRIEADAGARTVQWPPSRHMMKARGGLDVVMGARGGVTVSVGLIVIVSLISTLILTWAMISESTINARLIAFDKTQRILFFVFHRKDFVNWQCLHYDIIAHVERPVASFWRRSDRIVSVA